MKPLTIEDKAERYDYAVNKAKELILNENGVVRVDKPLFDELFPSEMEESEDEKIRKGLIEYFKDFRLGTFAYLEPKKIIAWLEKQGKKSVDKLKVSNELYEHIRNTYTCIYNAVRPNTFTDMTNYLLTAARSAQSALDMIENQGETKLLDYDDFAPKSATEATKGEKVDSQNCVKSVDKVEHKFEVGNWITFYGGKPFKILDIKREENGSLDYLLLNQDGHNSYYNKKYVDTNAKLWTIADAKPGDVLAAAGYIILFKKLLPHDGGVSYCHYDYACTNPQFNFNEDDNWLFNEKSEVVHPATEEQIKLLFVKMKEAGYEWDAEKKELKKIEDELITDAEIPFGAKDSELEEVFYSIPNGFHAEIKDDKVVIKKGEKKPAWSEEDEKYFKNVIDELVCLRNRNDRKYDYSEMTRLINWFKFLKDRVQPQVYKAINEHYELEEFAKIVRCNLTGISKAVQKLFEAKYLQLTGNKMYGGFKD